MGLDYLGGKTIEVIEHRDLNAPGIRTPSKNPRPPTPWNDPKSQNEPNSNMILKPTKSILKTSSSNASFGSAYKRNISSQSFSSTFAAQEINKNRLQMTFNGTTGEDPQVPLCVKSLDETHIQGKGSTQERANFVLGDTQASVDPSFVRTRRKVRLPRLRVVDMTPEEQESWEKEQLNAHINISMCQVDEAPFQLVEQTSLYRVHTLFSMLGLNNAYVTSFGTLVGIVALKDIRHAIEKMLQEK